MDGFQRARLAVMAAVVLGLVGCAVPPPPQDVPVAPADDGAPPRDSGPRELCDGTPGLRFALRVVANPGRLPGGEQVLADNGTTYLFVDGQCRFWVTSNPDQRFAPVHTGVLSAATARELAAALHYAEWPALAGQWQGRLLDGDSVVFYDDAVVVACHAACDLRGVPAAVHEMRDRAIAWVLRVAAQGTPVDGPQRMVAVRIGTRVTDDIQTFAWPLASVDLPRVALGEIDAAQLGYGAGLLVADPADAARLRDVRRSYVAGERGTFWYNYLPAVDATGARYRVYARDTTPFEDARGLVPAPPP